MKSDFTLKKGRGEVHLFSYGLDYLALDVNSDTLLEVSSKSYSILQTVNNHGEARANDFPYTYQQDFLELLTLYQEKALFSPPKAHHLSSNDKLQGMCLILDSRCNLACGYCFVKQRAVLPPSRVMTANVAKMAIDFLLKNSKGKEAEIDFFGGEPLLNYPVLTETVHYGRQVSEKKGLQLNFTLTTNGLLLTASVRKFLLDNQIDCVVSLDGPKKTNDYFRKNHQGHSSFKPVLHNLKAFLLENPQQFFVRGTFTRQTLNFARATRYLFNQGFPVVSMEPVVGKNTPFALKAEDLPTIYAEYQSLSRWYVKELKKGKNFTFFHFLLDPLRGPDRQRRIGGCGAGREYVAISPDGDIYPCHQFVGQPEFVLGNLSHGFTNQPLRNVFLTLGYSSKDNCKHCFARYYCSGGCHANSFFANNNLLVPEEIECNLIKKRLELALWVKAKTSSLKKYGGLKQ